MVQDNSFLLRQYKTTCKFSELATSVQFKFFIFSNVIAVTAWGPENAGTNLMTLTVCFVPSQMKESVMKMCKLFYFFTVLFKNHSFQPISVFWSSSFFLFLAHWQFCYRGKRNVKSNRNNKVICSNTDPPHSLLCEADFGVQTVKHQGARVVNVCCEEGPLRLKESERQLRLSS